MNRDADRVQQGRAPRQQADEAPNPNASPLDFDPVTGERNKRPTVQDAAVDRLRAADARKGDPTQGYLGFVTIAADQLTAETWYREIYASSDARTIIAREMARQWWGHLVGWRSYHDRWISEAIATYAANIFAKWNPTYDDKGNKRTSATLAWPRFLQRLTKRGLPVEELGPVVLGDRLASSFDDGLGRWIARVGERLAGPRGRAFAFQRKLMDGGTCESTAYQLWGYRCAAMCLALGNYHNMSERGRIAVESIRLSDLVGLVRFFEGLVRFDADAPRPGRPDPLRRRLEQRFARSRRELRRDPFA